MMKINIPNHMKKVIVTTLVSIIVAISSYLVMYITTFKQHEKEMSSKLYMIGKEQKDSIERLINEVSEEILFISNLNEIKAMNSSEIVKISSYLMAKRPMYKSLIVMDIKGNVMYGYAEEDENIYGSSYFEKAVDSRGIVAKVNYNSKDYGINIYCPIIDNKDNAAGMLFINMGIDVASSVLKSVKNEEGMESYLVNKEGVMITESKAIDDAVGKVKVNIKEVKLSIDYSETNYYKDYTGVNVYGRYFPIKGTDWTLIIESDYEYSRMKQEKTKIIGQIAVALQGVLVFFIQVYAKKRFNIDVKAEEEN